MARARNIKPGFFTNDELVELPFETRLLFIGLWTIADREGRLVDRPKKIKMEVFPADDVDCEKSLALLAGRGFITRYQVGAHSVIEIVSFTKHQAPHSTEKDSALPDADGYFTVNERTKNGGITGKFTRTKQETETNNVKPPLDNVKPQDKQVIPPSHNALNHECGILNPDSLIPESNSNTGGVAPPEEDAQDPAEPASPRVAPLPMRETPPVSDDPAVVLSIALRRQGVQANSVHPAVQDWAAKGVTVELLTEAVGLAREAKGDESIPANYLVPIIAKLLNPPAARAPTQGRTAPVNEKFNFGHLDRAGDKRAMDASMKRHGITVPDDDKEIEI